MAVPAEPGACDIRFPLKYRSFAGMGKFVIRGMAAGE